MGPGTILLCKVNRIFIWGPLREAVLLHKWSVIFVFYCLVFYCVTLVCCVCLYFVFIIIFVTEVCERSLEKTLLSYVVLLLS